MPLLGLERRGSRLYAPGARAALGEREEQARALEAELDASGLEPVRVDDRELAIFLEREGRLVRLGDGFAIGAKAYERAKDAVVAEIEASGEIALARARDIFGVGRRATQLVLERLDADGVTRRLGDRRVLRRR